MTYAPKAISIRPRPRLAAQHGPSIGRPPASVLNGRGDKMGEGLGVRRKTQDLVRVNKTNSLGTAFAQESCSQYAPNAQLRGAK